MTDGFADLDDIKRTWQQIDRRLERQHALAMAQFQEGRMRRMQSGLRPLYWGQWLQVIVGALFMVAAARVWYAHWDVQHLRIAGLLVQGYGLVAIVCAERTLTLIARIDPTAPVVDIQRQVAEVRSWYIRSGVAVGLPWWFLWLPVFMVLAAWLPIDVYARAPLLLVYCVGIGTVGLGVMLGLDVLARRPGWERLAKAHEATYVAASLRRAQAAIDEVKRFADDSDEV